MASNVQDAIMLFGDSLSQRGWEPHGIAQRLAYAYNRKLDIINRGMSGYNTEWAIPVLEQASRSSLSEPATSGVLTAPHPHCSASQRRMSGSTSPRLVRMITDPLSKWYSPETHVVLLTPPPVNTQQWRAHQEAQEPPQELDRDFEMARTYAKKVKEVGAKENVPVVDLWTHFWDACGHVEENFSEYSPDGLHLGERGYAIVFEELMKTISENYPELHYDRLQAVFVPHDQVDLENPRSTLGKRSIFGNQ